MSCSVQTQFPTGKPVTVSVNGIAIPRDAIVREMQHHPAAKPIAAWQEAARAWSCVNCCCNGRGTLA